MNKYDFLENIERIDKELAQKQVPIYARPVHAFGLLAPDYEGPLYGVDPKKYPDFVGPNLRKHIDDWYKDRHDKRVNMPTDRGKVPIILREETYLIRIPLVSGRPKIPILPLVEGLTESMIKSLTQSELQQIEKTFNDGFAFIYEMEDLVGYLGIKPSFKQEERQIIQSAIEDRDTAIRCLSGQSIDTNNACFHAQQHVEKMLKSFLVFKHHCTLNQLPKKPYKHDLESIFNKCAEKSATFYEVISDVGILKNIPMDIRYTIPKETPNNALVAVWAALRIGGLTACQISGIQRRKPVQDCITY